MKTLFASFAILALCAVGTAAPQFFDARNDAMGGVGVASSRYQTAGFAEALAVSGSLVYVAEGVAGLEIIDVSDPARPVLKASYPN